MVLGFLFAVLTVVFFGSWPVPTHTVDASPATKAFWLTMGHFVLDVLVFLLSGSTITVEASLLPMASGVLWGMGMICGFIAIQNIGVTRGLGLWVPIIVITSAAWGLFFFGEWWTLSASRLLFSGVAVILVLVAAFLIILSKEADTPVQNMKVGLLAAVILGLAHGSYFTPLHASAYSIFATFLPLSVGMTVVTFAYAKSTGSQLYCSLLQNSRMLAAGLILGAGNYMALLTVAHLGVTLGYPLTQLGIVVNTLWGIFYFREVQSRRAMVYLASGILLVVLGAVLMSVLRAA